MKKILVTILCFIETFVMSNFALAEDNNMSTYNLYVNSKHIEENNIIMRESVMLFPFRTIFESLGASVIWNDLNGDIDVQYKGKKYKTSDTALQDIIDEFESIYDRYDSEAVSFKLEDIKSITVRDNGTGIKTVIQMRI